MEGQSDLKDQGCGGRMKFGVTSVAFSRNSMELTLKSADEPRGSGT